MSEPEAIYWAVVKPLFEKINTGGSPDNFLASIAGLPRSEVGMFAAHVCLAEIFNGGFLQLYWNANGILAPEAVEGFTSVGMPQMAALLSDTSALLGEPYPRDRDDRWDALLNASRCSENTFVEICKVVSASGESLESKPAPSNPVMNFYRAFLKATEPLGFDALNEKAWELAETENGGFVQAANLYLQKLPMM